MNIFILDEDPSVAAQYHCDKHVVKMVLETAQMLSAALINNGIEAPYKLTHKNHPCTLWVGESRSNYVWLRELGLRLGEEYTFRYGKRHKSHLVIESMPEYLDIEDIGLTKFALAMPDEFKSDNPVESYRNYYNHKDITKTWTNRDVPFWVK